MKFQDVLDHMYKDPEFAQAAEERRAYIKAMITDIVPRGHEDEYHIRVYDPDFPELEIVSLDVTTGSETPVGVIQREPEYFCPLSDVDEEQLPLGLLGDTLEISIVKKADYPLAD